MKAKRTKSSSEAVSSKKAVTMLQQAVRFARLAESRGCDYITALSVFYGHRGLLAGRPKRERSVLTELLMTASKSPRFDSLCRVRLAFADRRPRLRAAKAKR